MNTDRELLEQAAKAARIDLSTRKWHGCWYVSQEPNVKNWNPLEDDGDALRLAVMLHINLEFGPSHVYAEIKNSKAFYADEESDGLLSNATRYVIVRAAAELGKSMP